MIRYYSLVREDMAGAPVYYIRLGLGIFWECSSNPREARRFSRRSAASEVLTKNGKHRQGWRVVPAPEFEATQ